MILKKKNKIFKNRHCDRLCVVIPASSCKNFLFRPTCTNILSTHQEGRALMVIFLSVWLAEVPVTGQRTAWELCTSGTKSKPTLGLIKEIQLCECVVKFWGRIQPDYVNELPLNLFYCIVRTRGRFGGYGSRHARAWRNLPRTDAFAIVLQTGSALFQVSQSGGKAGETIEKSKASAVEGAYLDFILEYS